MSKLEEGFDIVIKGFVSYARYSRVSFGSAQLLKSYIFVGNRLVGGGGERTIQIINCENDSKNISAKSQSKSAWSLLKLLKRLELKYQLDFLEKSSKSLILHLVSVSVKQL